MKIISGITQTTLDTELLAYAKNDGSTPITAAQTIEGAITSGKNGSGGVAGSVAVKSGANPGATGTISYDAAKALENAALSATDTVAKTSDITTPNLSGYVKTDGSRAITGAQTIEGALTVGKNGADGVAGSVVVLDGANPGASATMDYAATKAIANAGLVSTDTVAKTSDIPAIMQRLVIPAGEQIITAGGQRGLITDGSWRGGKCSLNSANPQEWWLWNYLIAGTYHIQFQVGIGSDRGIIKTHLKKPGESSYNLIITTDCYGGGGISEVSYTLVAETNGIYYVKFLVDSKNASSYNYYTLVGEIQFNDKWNV